MGRAMKTWMTDQLAREFVGLTGCVLVDYRGVPAEAMRAFRGKLRVKALKIRVLRNSLAARAFEKAGLPAAAKAISGPTAAIYGTDGAVAAARVLVEWNKKGPVLAPRGAVAEGEVIPAKGIEALSKLPDRPALRAMIAGAVVGAARGIAASMLAIPGSLARALQARVDKLEKEAPKAPEAAPATAPEATPPAPPTPEAKP